MRTQSVNATFEAACGRWVTCDWPTEFGGLKLNLNGLRSFQLERLAHATSGQESREWRKAAAWVRRIEDDAAHAQDLAGQARDACLQDNHTRAIDLAELAALIESTWHEEPIWDELLRSIRGEFSVP